MKNHIAVIDVGTNTARLAIFETKAQSLPVLVHEQNRITRLGEGLSITGMISPQAFARTLQALRDFRIEASIWSAASIGAIGTEALRRAANGQDFIDAAAASGITIAPVSGSEEGALVFAGATACMPQKSVPVLVVDSGGGSTELAFGMPSTSPQVISLPFGAVNSRDRFFSAETPPDSEITAMRSYATSEISSAAARMGVPHGVTALAVAGTISTLAMADLALEEFDPGSIHGHIITAARLSSLTHSLCAMDTAARAAIPGMEPGRADIIHAGALIYDSLAQALSLDAITVSLCDIRHGLATRIMTEHGFD